ncbi:hypothetical protein NN136_003393 [Vibrio cholerae]|nr:hypothetical protein [Vibrio cholerae]
MKHIVIDNNASQEFKNKCFHLLMSIVTDESVEQSVRESALINLEQMYKNLNKGKNK